LESTIWVLFMDVCTFSLRLRVYLSVLALYGGANALYWKSSERQNSTHLTLLKHQNTQTSLYKLSKNHWVIVLFDFFGSVRKKITTHSLFGSPCTWQWHCTAFVILAMFCTQRRPHLSLPHPLYSILHIYLMFWQKADDSGFTFHETL